MHDQNVHAFYKLCDSCNLNELVSLFGEFSDTSCIEMNYAYFIVYNNRIRFSDDVISPVLIWLHTLDPDIDVIRIQDDYMADENIPNDALLLACELGHFEVIKWLFTKEPYLSSFKNRCIICGAFKMSCNYENLDVTKILFYVLPEYIVERSLILNQAYSNAMSNHNTQTIAWLLEIDKNKLINS